MISNPSGMPVQRYVDAETLSSRSTAP